MKRLIGLGAALFLLCACVQQTPRQIVPQTAGVVTPSQVPFRAIAPAGYCLSDESDTAGADFARSLNRHNKPDETLLGIFRPCDGPLQRPATGVVDRLAIVASNTDPSTAEDAAFMDRRMFLAMMGNPKVSALMGDRILAEVTERTGDTPAAIRNFEYLGSDEYGAYNGLSMVPREPEQRRRGALRVVFGISMTGDYTLLVVGMSTGFRTSPHDWKTLQKPLAELLRSTIIAAEWSPAAVRIVPPQPQPKKPGAADLST
jgi:hypothetical protein